MNMEAARCCRCGQPIQFVSVSGVPRPLHKRGQPCAAVKRRPKKLDRNALITFPVLFAPAFERPVQVHACPCCNEVTHLVQLRTGVLLFDRLDWPWKRHICERTSMADYGVEHLRSVLRANDALQPGLALVAGSQQGWGTSSVHLAAVQELGEGGSRLCLKLRGVDLPPAVKRQEKIEPGTLVALYRNGDVRRLITTAGFEFVCVDSLCRPEELGIPTEWIDPDCTQI